MIKQRLKSKTYYLGAFVTVFGIIEQNGPLLRNMLGDWYGVFMVSIGISIFVLRELTTEPVSDK